MSTLIALVSKFAGTHYGKFGGNATPAEKAESQANTVANVKTLESMIGIEGMQAVSAVFYLGNLWGFNNTAKYILKQYPVAFKEAAPVASPAPAMTALESLTKAYHAKELTAKQYADAVSKLA